MKTKIIWAIPVICLLLMSVKPSTLNRDLLNLEVQVSQINGTYDGNEGYGYNFIVKNKADDSERTITFQKVNDNVMKEYDLDAELFLNQKFQITYTTKTVVTKDEDGFDNEEEILTITELKAL